MIFITVKHIVVQAAPISFHAHLKKKSNLGYFKLLLDIQILVSLLGWLMPAATTDIPKWHASDKVFLFFLVHIQKELVARDQEVLFHTQNQARRFLSWYLYSFWTVGLQGTLHRN